MMKENNIAESEMIESAFNFWFSDREHIRSPFPEYIREILKVKATDTFSEWVDKISDKAKKEINDEIIAEKFEEILFEMASTLVLTADEKLTIHYPFMPRIGDLMKEKGTNEESKVIGRSHLKRGDQSFFKVKLKTLSSGREWETEFELPE